MGIKYIKYDGEEIHSPKNNLRWSHKYKEAYKDGDKISNPEYDESFAIKADFAKVIDMINKKTKILISRGYEHTDGNKFKIGEEGAGYWSSAINYYNVTSAPYRVVTTQGKTVSYNNIDKINEIYKLGYELAVEIQTKARELKERVLACVRYSELEQIIEENKER
jgi:hypothetical protein